MIAKVLVKKKTLSDGIFDYLIDPELSLNLLSLVEVPFGRSKTIGIVVGIVNSSPKATKSVIRKLTNNPILTKDQMTIAKLIAEEFVSSLSSTIFSFLPDLNIKDLKKVAPSTQPKKRLKSRYLFVAGSFWERLNYYISLDSHDSQSLIVIPEIAQIQKAQRIYNKISDKKTFVWHSKVTSNEKLKILNLLLTGENITIFSTRHGLFLPFTKLENIFIDQPTNYAQFEDQEPYYNAYKSSRIVAKIYRSNLAIGDSMPDLVSFAAIKNKKLELVELSNKLNIQISGPLFHASSDLKLVEKLRCGKMAFATGFFKESYGLTCKDCSSQVACHTCKNTQFNANNNLCTICKNPAPIYCSSCRSISLLQTGTTINKLGADLKKYLPEFSFTIKDIGEINRLEPDYRIAIIPYFDFYSNFPFITFREKLFRNTLELADIGVDQIWILGEDLQNQDFSNLIKQKNWSSYLDEELKSRKQNNFPPFKTAIKIEAKDKKTIELVIECLSTNKYIRSGDNLIYAFLDFNKTKEITKELKKKFSSTIKLKIDPVEFA
jgi:primosomal protein N'